ncbi:MAG: lipopolysaccharide biosynthesis protein [Dyadobacter sp. 50-39]|uniref:lipopolysaccharide biosynthesis protein n=1 Tax=Dyadobacter sp. 50-39 TaxID=1895756 RepID=UPI00095E117B|nr:lipopolysaccharide biosynthesis protein [Dyadobacter sp. 50-39]OJV16951.1 MAG: lipopolysaccharide biosynthesis protein [Dyadobacter sp. 50-39]
MKVQQEIKKGAIIVFITRYSGILLGLGVNSVLARLLSPTEFGIVGVVTVFITFFHILSDIGLGAAIVQKQDFTNKDLSDIFKVSVLIAVVLAVAFASLSYGIAFFFDDQVYIPIGQLLAIQVFFSALSIVPKNMLIKAQAFKIMGFIDVGTSAFTGLLAVILAYEDFSFYSIIWRSIAYSGIVFVFYFFKSELKIRPGISFTGIRGVAKYSSYQFAFNCINYFSRNLDNILIGKYIGNAGLGLYNQAYQLMMYPVSNLTHVITPVIHPILAKYQDNKAVIFEEYMKIVKVLAILGLPISVFIYFASPEIIHLFLGEKWLEVIPILRILSISIWVQMIMSSTGSIFQAAGRTDLLFTGGVVCGAIMVLSILFGVLYFKSLEETAILLVVAFYLNFAVIFYVLIHNVLHQNIFRLYGLLARQIPSVVVLTVAYLIEAHIARPQTSGTSMLIISLGIKLCLMGLVTGLFNFPLIEPYFKKLSQLKGKS